MIIRKLFKFENAHIVRGCSSIKCKRSIHGHSYKVEVLLSSNFLDHGQMVYDFGLMKQNIKDLVESFDHAITIWNKDDPAYIKQMQNYSQRYVVLPVSPSAEQFARVIYLMLERLLALTVTKNGEREVVLHSVIVHETDTGYAQAFYDDAHSKLMGEINLEEIFFSQAVIEEFKDPRLWSKLLARESFINPLEV